MFITLRSALGHGGPVEVRPTAIDAMVRTNHETTLYLNGGKHLLVVEDPAQIKALITELLYPIPKQA